MTKELEIQPVHESDWDYLIVLDACRYDIFEEVYEDYFEGKLTKVRGKRQVFAPKRRENPGTNPCTMA